jgi:hypothetical protein
MTIGCMFFDGFELGDMSAWYAVGGGGVTVQDDVVHSGLYAGKLEGYADTFFHANDGTGIAGAVNSATPYARTYFIVDALPSAARVLASWQSFGAALLYPDGTIVLRLTDGSTTHVDSTFVVTPGVGFRLDFRAVPGVYPLSSWYVRINVGEASEELLSLVDTTSYWSLGTYFRLGSSSATYQWNADAANCYCDDVYICDDGWPPAGQCSKANYPTADSATDNAWVASAGNKWACVDDNPSGVLEALNDADYASCIPTGFKVQTFIHSANGGYAVADTPDLHAVVYWGRMRASGATVLYYRRVRQGATVLNSSGIASDTTANWTYPIFRTLDLASAAWSKANIDAFEIGAYARSYTTGQDAQLLSCVLLVDFAPTGTWTGITIATGKTQVIIF